MYIVKEEEEKGGCLVGSSSCKRQRFYIELKHGETAIVSWKKLLRDATEIDQCTPVKTLADKSSVGQRNNSFQRDEKLGHRTRVKSSDIKQRTIPKIDFPMVEAKKKDGLTRKPEDCKSAERLAVANAHSILPTYLSRSDTSALVRNFKLEGLHDVPVMYSKKHSAYTQDTSVFPLKTKMSTKHDIVQNTQKVFSERSRIHSETGNDSSDFMSQSHAIRSTPLQTYRQSRTSMDSRKSKVRSMVQNDMIGHATKTNISKNPGTTTCVKRKVTDALDRHILDPSPYREVAHKKVALKDLSLFPKSSHYAKTVQLKPLKEQPLFKKPKMEVQGKPNMKIRFHLKPEQEHCKSEEQVSHLK